jgi:hypothetical protein
MNITLYETNERALYHKQLTRNESAPLAERKEAFADFASLLRDPSALAVRVGFLLDGNYGYGSYVIAKEVVANKRLNRAAILSQMVAALECFCPGNYARKAYLALNADEKAAVDSVFADAIANAQEA